MGQRRQRLQQMYGKFFNYRPSTITLWIFAKNVPLKGNDVEIISSKQEEKFKATTFVFNILKLNTNPKVLIQEFAWSLHLFGQNSMYMIAELSAFVSFLVLLSIMDK